MSSLPSQQWLDYFNNGFTIASHELLSWGYEDARDEIKSSHSEEFISKAIVRAIKARLSDFHTPERYTRFFAEVETHPMEDERAGRDCPRIDIQIESGEAMPRPQFIFEAKRLKKGSHPIGDYIGDAGLGCFLRCQYAENYPCAGMIGYMQDADSISYWESQLVRKFDEDKLDAIEPVRPMKVLDELPNEWFSKHRRTKGGIAHSDVSIYHILLACHEPIS